MAERGTVVRSNHGSHPYTARSADGDFLGNFASVSEAQAPINNAANALLRWTREDRTGIEAYVAEDV